jgi:hypothetical protein
MGSEMSAKQSQLGGSVSPRLAGDVLALVASGILTRGGVH